MSPRALVPGQVRVVVESAEDDEDRLTIRLRVVEGDIPELDGPASLFLDEIGDGIELHQGTRTRPDGLEFRTFGRTNKPPVGAERIVQWWWIPGTAQMLRDATRWQRATVSEHWFCPLTYENLDEGDQAYTDGNGNWISVSGWEQFVRDDRLRLRR